MSAFSRKIYDGIINTVSPVLRPQIEESSEAIRECVALRYESVFQRGTDNIQIVLNDLSTPSDKNTMTISMQTIRIELLRKGYLWLANETHQSPEIGIINSDLLPESNVGFISYIPEKTEVFWGLPPYPALIEKRNPGIPETLSCRTDWQIPSPNSVRIVAASPVIDESGALMDNVTGMYWCEFLHQPDWSQN